MKQSIVAWLLDNLISEPFSEQHFKHNEECWDKAEEMEKEEIIKHSLELAKILISNPYETSGKMPTELIDSYINETFKSE
jgi:hypothetical protein